jgi:hypothetical protein
MNKRMSAARHERQQIGQLRLGIRALLKAKKKQE